MRDILIADSLNHADCPNEDERDTQIGEDDIRNIQQTPHPNSNLSADKMGEDQDLSYEEANTAFLSSHEPKEVDIIRTTNIDSNKNPRRVTLKQSLNENTK